MTTFDFIGLFLLLSWLLIIGGCIHICNKNSHLICPCTYSKFWLEYTYTDIHYHNNVSFAGHATYSSSGSPHLKDETVTYYMESFQIIGDEIVFDDVRNRSGIGCFLYYNNPHISLPLSGCKIYQNPDSEKIKENIRNEHPEIKLL